MDFRQQSRSRDKSKDPKYEQLKDPHDESQEMRTVTNLTVIENSESIVPRQSSNSSRSQYQAIAGSSSSPDLTALTVTESPTIKKRSNRSISKSIILAEAQGRLELSHVLTNSKLLNVFAQFLCVEFNIENLLFIIEIVQFKRYIKENEEDCSSILGEYLSIPQHRDLPHFENRMDEEEMMKSLSIVSRVTLAAGRKPKSKLDVYLYGLYIVNKYIRFDSSHEINIPGRVRRRIIRKTGNEQQIRKLSISQLQVAFDDAFVEILALLQDPLSRLHPGSSLIHI